MASTTMTSANALSLKLWATEDWVNPGQRPVFGHMFSRGSVFYAEEFLGQKARGDQITYDYTNKLTGIPVGEGGTLDGNEEALLRLPLYDRLQRSSIYRVQSTLPVLVYLTQMMIRLSSNARWLIFQSVPGKSFQTVTSNCLIRHASSSSLVHTQRHSR